MKLFHDLLEAHGYHPIGTRDGMEALDLARKHRPDLILMDIRLPEVSGLEVTNQGAPFAASAAGLLAGVESAAHSGNRPVIAKATLERSPNGPVETVYYSDPD